MRILYFGTSTFAIPALRALVNNGHTIVGVVTQPDRPAGRGGKLTPPPVKVFAESLGLPILQPESCRTPEFLETARQLDPELSVVAAYGQFLPDALLTLPRLQSVNLHGSLLPQYRGAAPIQRAIWHGEEKAGVCLMWMVRAMDAGDVIACAKEPILPDDNAGTLTERLAARAADLLIDWLPALENGTAPHIPQDPAQVTFAPVIGKDERRLDWTRPAQELWWQIRALAPSPGAQATFRGAPIKILAAQPVEKSDIVPEGEPGTIVESNSKSGLSIATGAGLLLVTLLQPAGKRPMPAADFLRGARVAVGEQFTS